ncbi:TNF receptor-associated factor 5-like isoform X2 [Pecten maximus]|uniref:TNF receptor-associated factor 5-like isoform X2 n=1 Tax=Pecten maximus TaxID=6579 RepID=UPI001459075A|nr:TNF receptor-associated factor 5-like isoform X2 [Pecten maximus]
MSDKRIEFLNLSIELMCWKCGEALANPTQLSCGHRVCERCLDDVCGSQDEIICKMDKCGEKSRRNEVFMDMCCHRQIQDSKVHCPNRENGCEEVMALKDLKLGTNVLEHNTPQRGILDGQLVDSISDDGISIRQEVERVSETWKNIHGPVGEVKKQNKEVAVDIEDAHKVMRKVDSLTLNVTLLEIRFNELSRGQPWIANHTGVFIWKLQNYSDKRKQTDHGINSPPFYSSCYGYKICGRVYLNGDGLGQGTHLSFFVAIMKGEFDAVLPWPFRQRVTLTLMDQNNGKEHLSDTFRPDPESSSFRRPMTDMNVASGCPRFVEHSRLETSTYLQDDILFLKIKVDVNDLSDGASFQGQSYEVEGEEEGR